LPSGREGKIGCSLGGKKGEANEGALKRRHVTGDLRGERTQRRPKHNGGGIDIAPGNV